MKKSKKLMILGLSLATGAVAATSAVSSFAWFSMNTKVTATGMSVKATVSKNLLISDAQSGTYNPSVALADSELQALVPSSTIKSTTPKFFKLSLVGNGMVATDEAYVYNTVFTEATANADYLSKSVWIQSVGDKATNLTATFTVNNDGNKEALDPALRLMLVAGGSAYLYKVNDDADDSYNAIKTLTAAEQKVLASAATLTADASGKALSNVTYYEDSDCATESTGITAGTTDVTAKYVKIPAGAVETSANNGTESVSTYTTNGSVIVGTLNKDTPVEVKIYIWYEGQDSHCYATNAVKLDTTSFELSFTVTA